MELLDIGIVALGIVAFSLVSGRLASTPVTAPMVFVIFGLVVGPNVLGVVDITIENQFVRVLAELTLVLLLFTDAARIDMRNLREHHGMPIRMLAIGMPLTIVLGTALAIWIFPENEFWEMALLATVLAPTDAALGQTVVTSPVVPVRVRQAINIESGLNDGIAAPLVTIFLALALAEVEVLSASSVARFIAEEIGYGLLIGLAIGVAGGLLVRFFSTRGWMDGAFRQLGVLALAVGAWALATAAGGNGFIAAFVGGLAFGSIRDIDAGYVTEFTEDEGQLLNLLTFMIFGGVFVGPALGDLTWQTAVYVVLSLSVIRMLPVGLSLLGSGYRLDTIAFVGWFGPRGLASIIFGLIVVEEAAFNTRDELFVTIAWTVLVSVFAHGLTAEPLANWYGRHAEDMAGTPEMQEVPEHPVRHTPIHLR